MLLYCIVFIHFYSASRSMSLSEALPATAIDTVGVYMPKLYRQLHVKDLPKVLTWRLERDSNPRPSSRKASILPMCHHAPHPLKSWTPKIIVCSPKHYYFLLVDSSLWRYVRLPCSRFSKTVVPKLPWIGTHLSILWPAPGPTCQYCGWLGTTE